MSSGTFEHTNIAHFCLVFMIPPALNSINYLILISQKTSFVHNHVPYKFENDDINILCVEESIYDVKLSKNHFIFMRNLSSSIGFSIRIQRKLCQT